MTIFEINLSDLIIYMPYWGKKKTTPTQHKQTDSTQLSSEVFNSEEKH